MQASRTWQHHYFPYLLSISSLIVGMALKELCFSSWNLFYNSPATSMISESIAKSPATSSGVLSSEQIQSLLAEGDACFNENNIEEAVKKYKDALNKDLFCIMTLMRLATAACRLEKYEQAEYYYRTAIAIQPTLVSAYNKLGLIQQKLHKIDAALRTFTAMTLLQPNNYEGFFNLSRVYSELNEFDKAIEYAKKAIELQPDNVHNHLNLGHIYNKQGDTQAACVQYENAIKVEPNLANAHYNLGYTLRVQREPQKAIPHLLKALELQPYYPDAHIALAQSYWTFGNFKKAWEDYEWRWKQLGMDPKSLPIPLWDGSPLNGKKIFLYSEQGMGDTLQFIRYAKKIKEEYNGYVICKVQKPLEKLLKLCPYIDQVVVGSERDESDIATQSPLLNLPGILNTTVETIPHPIPYLYADKELTALWKKKLAADKNIKVGLCWHVLPAHEIAKSPLSIRSIDLKLLAPLADIPGVTFYSLQKMDGVEQVLYLPEKFKVHTFGDDFDESHGRFMDSAALIANLDLVISVDTSIIHLAGGMGKNIWTLLPYSPDCRWDLDDYTTPWYSNMRLFRQPAWKDWNSVVERLKKELKAFVEAKRKGPATTA